MNQANIEHLVSRLRYNVKPRRKLKNVDGPEGRLRKIQKTLTALIKFERIEMHYPRADETRGYVERLISEAIRHGPEHKMTMDMANYYILEKQLIHKLFKVLAPRYKDYTTSYTKIHKAPNTYPVVVSDRAILELKGNIYPSVEQPNYNAAKMIHNILLSAAKTEFDLGKCIDSIEKLKQQDKAEVAAQAQEEVKKLEAEAKEELKAEAKEEVIAEAKEEVIAEAKEEAKADTKEELKAETKAEVKKEDKPSA